MPGFSVSPLAVVNQIKSNLQDRYKSGYPILKELIQNADDAGARRFRLDALPGWPGADNPLLQGAGLLVVNDEALTDDDRARDPCVWRKRQGRRPRCHREIRSRPESRIPSL